VTIVVNVVILRSGVHITIQNTGSQPLRSVVLNIARVSYGLGDMPPGGTTQMRFYPVVESHLKIEFIDADGQTNRLDASVYFKRGYRGTIDISVKDGVIQKNEQNIGPWWSLW
jgi:hypothetical protein